MPYTVSFGNKTLSTVCSSHGHYLSWKSYTRYI